MLPILNFTLSMNRIINTKSLQMIYLLSTISLHGHQGLFRKKKEKGTKQRRVALAVCLRLI